MSRNLSSNQVLTELGYTYDSITVIKLKEILRGWGVKGISVPKDQLVEKVRDEYNRIKRSEESLSSAPGKSITRITKPAKSTISPIRKKTTIKKTTVSPPKSPSREPVYYYSQSYVVMALSEKKEPVSLGVYTKKSQALNKIKKYMDKHSKNPPKIYMEKTNLNGKMKETSSRDHDYFDIIVE